MFNSLWPHGLQHTRLPCPSWSAGVCSDSCPLSQWCHLTNSSSAAPSPFAFNLSQQLGLFQWVRSSHQVGQSIGASALASVLPMNIQGWFPLRLTGLISFSSKDSEASSLAPQFKSICSLALNLLYGSILISVHDYWKNHSFDYMDFCWQNDVSAF